MTGGQTRFFYFDVGNVLLTFDPWRLVRRIAAAVGIPPEQVWNILFQTDLYRRYECGQIATPDFFQCFAQAATRPLDYPSFAAAAYDVFEPNEPVMDFVTRLHQAGCGLGILSNTNDGHWSLICDGRYPVISGCFEHYVLSCRIGSMKPDAAIYQAAIRQAGCRADEIFFVDDRPENVAGAQQAGLDAVLYTSAAQLARDLQQRGVPVMS